MWLNSPSDILPKETELTFELLYIFELMCPVALQEHQHNYAGWGGLFIIRNNHFPELQGKSQFSDLLFQRLSNTQFWCFFGLTAKIKGSSESFCCPKSACEGQWLICSKWQTPFFSLILFWLMMFAVLPYYLLEMHFDLLIVLLLTIFLCLFVVW